MGLFDSFFGGSESDDPQILEAFPGQMGILSDLAKAAKGKGLEAIDRAGQPYPEPLIAPLSGFQQAGLGKIGDVLSRPYRTESPLFQQGQRAISEAAEGFDPFKDLRFKALQTNLARELKRAKDRIAARSSSKDEFFGGGRMDQERELEEKAFGDISSLAGQLEGESKRMSLAAAPEAIRLSEIISQEPTQRLQESLFGIGAAPRGFQQEEISADQAERSRQLEELYRIGLGTALQTSMFKPDFFTPSYGPSMFSNIAGGIGAMGGLGELGSTIGSIFGGGQQDSVEEPGAEGNSFLGSSSPTGSNQGDIQMAMTIASMFSDATLKEEIKTITSALDKVNRLDGKSFKFINGTNSGGVIAQEIESVLPEAVGERDGYKTVDYTAIIGLLINAVQELSRKVG